MSVAQLHEAGLGEGAVRHRVLNGRLVRLHRGVYAVGHAQLTPLGWRWAAVLACGGAGRAALSHRSAAAVWDLLPSPAKFDVSTLAAAQGRRRRSESIAAYSRRDDALRDRRSPPHHRRSHPRRPHRHPHAPPDRARRPPSPSPPPARHALPRCAVGPSPGPADEIADEGAGNPADGRTGDHPVRARGALPRRHRRCSLAAARGQRQSRPLRGRLPLARRMPHRRDRRPGHAPHPSGVRGRPPPRRRPLDAGVQNAPLHPQPGRLRATIRPRRRTGNPPRVASRRMDAEVTLRVNGEAHSLTVDTRTTLLDLLREHLGLTGAKKGCDHGQCGACTSSSTAAARTRASRSRSPTTAPSSRPSRAWRRRRRAPPAAGGVHRARRVPVRLLHARPAVLRGRHARCAEAGSEAEGVALDAADEIRERMSGNLCRCGAYPNIVARSRTWSREGRSPTSARERRRWRGRGRAPSGARYLGGGTNLVDLMKLGVAEPQRLVDVSRLPHDAIEETRAAACASAPRVRNSDLATHPLVRERYPVLSAGAARRRVRPAAQPRHRRRQPAPAHALPLLPGRHEAVQQAPARARAARRARASTATSRSSATREHCVATHPSDMAVALAAIGATVHVLGANGERSIPMPGLHRLPGDEPQHDTVLNARRPDHRGRARRARAALDVPEGPRPRVVRVRGVLASPRRSTWRTAR